MCKQISEFSDLVGLTLTAFETDNCDYVRIGVMNGEKEEFYRLEHDQDCCESVSIEDICGNPEDMIGEVIAEAYESTNSDEPRAGDGWEPESFTWTFYNMQTNKGNVTIRFYGTSNGFYSESVSFYREGRRYGW